MAIYSNVDEPNKLSEAGILEASNTEQFLNLAENISSNATIFFDIDDTIIAPASKSFRTAPNNQIIEQIKKDKHLYSNFEIILSHWRLQRKSILTDKHWPTAINLLKQTQPVYALTKVDTGKIGHIDSMEKWRYEELKQHQIEFCDNLKIAKYINSTDFLNASKIFQNRPTFIRGIFLTGSASKREVLQLFLHLLNSQEIVLIDDRIEHLLDIQKYCQKNNIPFLGILFKGAETLPGKYDSKLAEFQKEYLIQHEQWLEDEQAEQLYVRSMKE